MNILSKVTRWFFRTRWEMRLPTKIITCPQCEGARWRNLDGSPARTFSANATRCLYCKGHGVLWITDQEALAKEMQEAYESRR